MFNSIKPLFVGKPLLIVVNKIDVVRPEQVRPDAWKLIQDLANPEANIRVISMSTLTDEGVDQVKEQVSVMSIACLGLLIKFFVGM